MSATEENRPQRPLDTANAVVVKPRLSALEIIFFVIFFIVAVITAAYLTILGSFLSFAGLETTIPGWLFSLIMGIAVYSPTVIVIVTFCLGIYRIGARRPAAFLPPLLGAVMMVVIFFACAAVLSI